jgi:hypothetical protein
LLLDSVTEIHSPPVTCKPCAALSLCPKIREAEAPTPVRTRRRFPAQKPGANSFVRRILALSPLLHGFCREIPAKGTNIFD